MKKLLTLTILLAMFLQSCASYDRYVDRKNYKQLSDSYSVMAICGHFHANPKFTNYEAMQRKFESEYKKMNLNKEYCLLEIARGCRYNEPDHQHVDPNMKHKFSDPNDCKTIDYERKYRDLVIAQEKAEIIKEERRLRKEYENYITTIRKNCELFGYTDGADIGNCVQKELAKRSANQRSQGIKQQTNNFNGTTIANAATWIANDLDKFNNQSKSKICNFKDWNTGIIITGDCSRQSIIKGNITYWKE